MTDYRRPNVWGSNFRQEQDIPLLSNVHTGNGAHRASYSMDTVVFPGDKAGRGVKLTSHINLTAKVKN